MRVEPMGDFPLQHTEVTATVGGYLARTCVEQIYANPYKDVIEAVYVFPLPESAAVICFGMGTTHRSTLSLPNSPRRLRPIH